jgi:hypothetical protein
MQGVRMKLPLIVTVAVALAGCSPKSSTSSIERASRLDSLHKVVLVHLSTDSFVEDVFTRRIILDDTPDNSTVLERLLSAWNWRISRDLIARLEAFYSVKANQTMMRGLFLQEMKKEATHNNGWHG